MFSLVSILSGGELMKKSSRWMTDIGFVSYWSMKILSGARILAQASKLVSL
jgi:hypothetical protein